MDTGQADIFNVMLMKICHPQSNVQICLKVQFSSKSDYNLRASPLVTTHVEQMRHQSVWPTWFITIIIFSLNMGRQKVYPVRNWICWNCDQILDFSSLTRFPRLKDSMVFIFSLLASVLASILEYILYFVAALAALFKGVIPIWLL